MAIARIQYKSDLSEYTIEQYAEVCELSTSLDFDDWYTVCVLLSMVTNQNLEFWEKQTNKKDCTSILATALDASTNFSMTETDQSFYITSQNNFKAYDRHIDVVDAILYHVKANKVVYALRSVESLSFEEMIQLEQLIKQIVNKDGVRLEGVAHLSTFLAYVMGLESDNLYVIGDEGLFKYDYKLINQRALIFNIIPMNIGLGILSEYLNKTEELLKPYNDFWQEVQRGVPKATTMDAYFERWGLRAVKRDLAEKMSDYSPAQQLRMPYRSILELLSQLKEENSVRYREQEKANRKQGK